MPPFVPHATVPLRRATRSVADHRARGSGARLPMCRTWGCCQPRMISGVLAVLEYLPELAASRSLTCMTTSTDWPRGGPAKDRETSGNEGMLKRRNCLLTDPFQCVLAGKQSGLHRIPKPRVAGSIPAGGTGEKSWSQRGVVPDSPGLHDLSLLPFPTAALLAVVLGVMLNRPGITQSLRPSRDRGSRDPDVPGSGRPVDPPGLFAHLAGPWQEPSKRDRR